MKQPPSEPSGFRSMEPGNDEREQTVNQLLTEMDGFEGNKASSFRTTSFPISSHCFDYCSFVKAGVSIYLDSLATGIRGGAALPLYIIVFIAVSPA